MNNFKQYKTNWFKSRINELTDTGLSKKEISERLGIPPQQLNNMLNGNRSVSDKFLDSFIEKFNIRLSSSEDNKTTSATASHSDTEFLKLGNPKGIELQDNHNPYHFERIYIPGLDDVDEAIYMQGESMQPIVKQRDIILYRNQHPHLDNIIWGGMYCVVYQVEQDYHLILGYIKKSDKSGYIRLEFANPRFETKEIPFSLVKAIRHVKAVINFLE